MGAGRIMNQEREEAKGLTSDDAQESPVSSNAELESTVNTLQSDLKERTAERDSLNDRLLRLHAEFENYKKRAARERSEFVRRSEEHTSELQSPLNIVCRLLL